MPVASFDQFPLGPRFGRLEFERSVAMRRLALQNFPLELADVSKDIVRTMENTVQATIEYSEQLAFEVRKISTNMKALDAIASAGRMGQILGLLEDLEQRIQGLIRYGWMIEREWSTYVKTRKSANERRGRSGSGEVFPTGYLRGLDSWYMVLGKAMGRMRMKTSETRYGQGHGAADSAQIWEGMGGGALDPTSWSTEYVLERARMERGKKRRVDAWLTAVPGLAASTKTTDMRRRTALHYAARSSSDLVWLKRLNLADVQELRKQGAASRQPALAATDLEGDTALTIAARTGNVEAVRFIIEESGVDAVAAGLGDAAVVAWFEGQQACVELILARLAAFPEKVAAVIRMAVFYGFGGLFETVCAALKAAGARAYMGAEVALEHSTRRAGGCSLLHLAVLNDHMEMVRCALRQDIFRASVFDVHHRDDAGLSPLDVANYFGYRTCADELLAFSADYDSPVYDGPAAEHPSLQVAPFVPAVKNLGSPSETCSVFVTLGANDLRRCAKLPPVSIDLLALQNTLEEMGLPRSTHLLLRIDSEQGMAVNADADCFVVDVTALLEAPEPSPHCWLPPALFHTVYPDKFVLRMDLIALVDYALDPYATEQKVVAQAALTVPPVYLPEFNQQMLGHFIPLCLTAGNYLQAVFLSSTTGAIVGEANLEVAIATPYSRTAAMQDDDDAMLKLQSRAESLSLNASDAGELSHAVTTNAQPALPLFRPGHTLVYGHRGSGMNCPYGERPGCLQLGENTVLSMENAIRDGVAAVEFDVQLTRDMVPIIYHDWLVAETGLDTPVNALVLSQFKALNPHSQLYPTRSCDDLTTKASELEKPSILVPQVVANSKDTVGAPFATLHDLFNDVPAGAGFDIEIKYPMPDEADSVGMATSFEVNLFVDRILDVIYSYVGNPLAPESQRSSGYRPILFTSFHPDICLLLAHKVGRDFPIMLLTDAGMSAMADSRCNSLDVAVRLCKWAGLAGVVSHVGPVVQSPRVASLVRRNHLLLATYGGLNQQPEHIRLQKAYHVDVVITDNARIAVAAAASNDNHL
ncbi:Glycerophosphocholine phosphodiesterase [Coemansia sp. RSA 988]|nr:Glycerophosphocholine phosphodiesterase [Coemansia sp. RSA 988]